MNVTYERVVAHLDRLKLRRVAELLDPICEQATKDSLSYVDFLDRLLEAESASRAERRLLAKTRLAHFPFAVALGMEAVAHGHNVYFITVPELLDQLARDVQENRLAERLNKLRVPTLLILDEMGYRPLDQVATSFLFQLVSRRYTRGSIIVTSNKSYGEWGSVFGDDAAAAAVIDRLLHYSSTVNIRGDSYRLKDKKRAGIFTMPAAKTAS